MRSSKPLHLADLDPQRAAEDLTQGVYARAKRDALRLGFVLSFPTPPAPAPKPPTSAAMQGAPSGYPTPLPSPAPPEPKPTVGAVLGQSKIHKLVRACVEWAKLGKGKPEEMAAALRELRADLDGVEPGEVSGREWDLTTAAGVTLVAAEARLALAEGRTVEATEVATLASVDERSIRATVQAGTLTPVGPGRPMRFAADVARQYLYARGVPGFAAPPPRVGPQ
jgi:hypothetical protein